MTADIINLRRARKAKARTEKDAQAAENRAKSGRSKAERKMTNAVLKLDRSRLDSARRSNPDEDEDLDPGTVS
jgi:Domain of unknown function (DUF4169)